MSLCIACLVFTQSVSKFQTVWVFCPRTSFIQSPYPLFLPFPQKNWLNNLNFVSVNAKKYFTGEGRVEGWGIIEKLWDTNTFEEWALSDRYQLHITKIIISPLIGYAFAFLESYSKFHFIFQYSPTLTILYLVLFPV